MSNRVCAHCGAAIPDTRPDILFCDRYCCEQYLIDHDAVPDEPVTA